MNQKEQNPSMMDAHNLAVSAISTSIKSFHARQQPFRLYHGATNSTRASTRTSANTINTSALTHILRIDTEKRTALVEPNVPLSALLSATLSHGLVPPVVPEFPTITIGGAFSGTSGESSSFKYGVFDRTILSIEIVLGDGEVVRASKDERRDLFFGAASGFGTLGVVTALEVELVVAGGWVRLVGRKFRGTGEAVGRMSGCMEEGHGKEDRGGEVQFLEAIVFGGEVCGVVTLEGRMVDEVPMGEEVVRCSRRGDPWFYLDVQRRASKAKEWTVYIPLTDYLFRYDRGAFWAGRYAFRYFLTPFNRITRYLLDDFMHADIMYRALHKSGLARQFIIQDVAVPLHATEEFEEWLECAFNIYPLWLCPIRMRGEAADSPHGLFAAKEADVGTEYLVNFGIWGQASSNIQEFISQNRAIEKKVQELGGKKCLYAHAYYTEDEFWEIYDRKKYDALREKYHASSLPNLYEKVSVDLIAEDKAARAGVKGKVTSVWPFNGLYGVYKAWKGSDYLLGKTKSLHKQISS